MRERKWLFIILLVLACNEEQSYTNGLKSNDGIALQVGFTPGESYEYACSMNMRMVQSVAGMDLATTEQMDVTLGYHVLRREAMGTALRVTYKRLAVLIKSPALYISFNSDSAGTAGSSSGANVQLKRLIGKTFDLIVQPDGYIKRITGMDTLGRTYDTQVPDPMGDAAIYMVNQMFSDSVVKAIICQQFDFYPQSPVRVGDNWSKASKNLLAIGNTTVNYFYRLASVKSGLANVELAALIHTPKNARLEQWQAGDATVSMQGQVRGIIQADIATGMLRKSVLDYQLSGTLNVLAMEVPFKMTTRISGSGRQLK